MKTRTLAQAFAMLEAGEVDALYARGLLPLGKPSPAPVTPYMLNALPEQPRGRRPVSWGAS